MSFIAAATTVGTFVSAGALTGTGAALVGGALMGAGAGALYSGITGDGNIGESALIGGAIGATAGGAGSAMGGGSALSSTEAAMGGGGAFAGEGFVVPGAVEGAGTFTTAGGAGASVGGYTPAQLEALAAQNGVFAEGAANLPGATSGLTSANTAQLDALAIQNGVAGEEAALSQGIGNTGSAQASNQVATETGKQAATETGKQAAKDAAIKTATTQGGLTGTDVMLGTGALMYLTQLENSKYGVPNNEEYTGPLSKFNYDPKNYTPITTAQPNPAYRSNYTNYKTNPYTAAKGGVVAMADGGIAMANPSIGPVEQMSRDNATGNNMMFPQAGINSPSFASATNRPMAQNMVPSAADTSVDPYTGSERFAEGGIAATPEAQARPAPSLPSQITRDSINTNDALAARLQSALVSPQVQQALAQNPLQQAPVQAPVQAQPYAAPAFTRPTSVPATPFDYPAAIPGTTAYNTEQARLAAEAEAARQAAAAADQGSTQFYSGGGKTVSNMEAIDDYVAQYATDPAAVTAKAKSGDWNAMLAMNKVKKTPNQNYAAGGGVGHLGGYAAGGNPRLLKGPGDGMSDNIPATIGGKQPARLADGEFVIPADVVSHLGNGSTDAGAKHLYSMMDKVRKARTGNKKQGKQIKPQKYMPK